MKLALTTNARLYKNSRGEFFTPSVYDYDFFTRYLDVFEQVKLIAHTEETSNEYVENMVRVDGPRLEIYEVPFPHGKIQYIKQYKKIAQALDKAWVDCDAAVLRIPDQLAFQLYKKIKNKMPIAVEITSDPWMLFSPKNYRKSILRPFLRLHWHCQQKKICKSVLGTAYVTKQYLQQRYFPTKNEKGFTTFYTDTDVDDAWFNMKKQIEEGEELTLIHVATSIGGNAKGHRELIIAAGELIKKGHKIKVVLVGAGDLNKENQEIVQKYDISSCIYKTGSLTKLQLKEQLSKADVFVFPSYVEGLPRVLIEAMAMGLPCVATELPGIKELLPEKWLVPIKDYKLLQEKIEKFIVNKPLISQVGQENRAVARDYDVSKVEQTRKEFYLKLKSLIK